MSTSSKMSSSSNPSSSSNLRFMLQEGYQSTSCNRNQYGSYQSNSNYDQSGVPYQQVSSFTATDSTVGIVGRKDSRNIATDSTVGIVGRKDSRNETILSGQFMVSEISEETDSGVQVGTDEADHEYNSDYGEGSAGAINASVISPIDPDVKSMEFTTECKETMFEYQGKRGVQSVTIDKSLSRLFHCMSLAYSGKLTSPKWKSFKGLRLKLKDKIRLNNIIWRAWHMQC